MEHGERKGCLAGAVFTDNAVTAAIVDKRRRVLSRAQLELEPGCDYREAASVIARCAGLAARALGMELENCGGVGVGCPGITNRDTGEVVYSGLMGWNHAPLGKELQKNLTVPVGVAELSGCAALGEVMAGAAARCSNAVLFLFGQGIDSGVIIDGEIFAGKYCAGARLGHCTLVSGGKTCSCGRKGCFEAYASFEALSEQAAAAAGHYKNTLLAGGGEKMLSPAQILDCARKGDRAAKRVLNQYLDYVCDGIVNAVNVLRPEIVVLGGEGGAFWRELLGEINTRCCAGYYGAAILPVPKVVQASLGEDAGLIGAAFVAPHARENI